MDAAAPILSMNQDQYQSYVTASLRAEVDEYRSPVKKLAEIAGSSIAAAKHWYGNEATPNGIYMSRLRARFPNFAAKMDDLEGKKRALDPNFTTELSEFFISLIRKDPKSPLAQLVFETFHAPQNEAAKAAAE